MLLGQLCSCETGKVQGDGETSNLLRTEPRLKVF